MSFFIRFLFVFIFLYDVCLGMPIAQKGTIDLSQWDMDKNENEERRGSSPQKTFGVEDVQEYHDANETANDTPKLGSLLSFISN